MLCLLFLRRSTALLLSQPLIGQHRSLATTKNIIGLALDLLLLGHFGALDGEDPQSLLFLVRLLIIQHQGLEHLEVAEAGQYLVYFLVDLPHPVRQHGHEPAHLEPLHPLAQHLCE